MEAGKKRRLIFSSVTLCILIAAVLLYLNRPAQAVNINDDFFVSKITSDADFIDSGTSKYFTYTATVRVDDSRGAYDLVPVDYIIDVTPKAPDTFPNVLVTAFLDDKMQNWIVTDNVLYFGTKKTEQITIRKNNNTGIVTGKTAWIKSGYDRDALERDLKLPIKVKVSWEGNTEYAVISNAGVQFK